LGRHLLSVKEQEKVADKDCQEGGFKLMKSLSQFMERLTTFEPTGFPVVSLYLNAQADQHGHDNYHIFVRKELTARAKTFEAGSAERESFDRDVELLNEYLDKEVRPSANGIAIFSCAAADFFEAVQLDAPIEENSLYVYNQPHLYPLARLMDQYPRYAVLVCDTNSARIFVFGRGKTLDTEEVQNVKTNRSQVGGWSQMRYQRHVENYHLHHAKEVVEVLERVVNEDRVEHVILAGDEVIIPVLRPQLPKALEEKVIDVIKLDKNTPEHEIFESTMKTLRVHDAVSDAEKVKQMFDSYRGRGLAVVGVAETLAALSNGQVEELLLSASLKGIKYEEEKVDKVLAAYAPGAGGEQPDTSEPRMVADELVSRAQQMSSARVTFIEDESLLASVGGVGALLRYRMD
jgi:peptide subunit release factor 1 (eRF1)